MLRILLPALIAAALSGCIAVNDYGIFAVRDGGADDSGGRDAGRDAGVDAGCGEVEQCGGGDDDCDGTVDEDCPTFFGRPSPIVLEGPPATLRSPHLSRDGLRLYYVQFSGTTGTAVVAQRRSITEHFGPASRVAGVDLGSYNVYDITLSADESEIFASARTATETSNDIFTATRSADGSFGPLSRVASAMAGPFNEGGPSLSGDGTELFFYGENAAAVVRIWRVTRSAPGLAFGLAEAIQFPTFETHDFTPHLSDDGLTLLFARIGMTGLQRLVRATRASRDTIVFGMPEDIVELASTGFSSNFPTLSEQTGEIFFTSDRPWSAGSTGVWRARICRDGPCVEGSIACATGMMSPDQRHCYTLGPSSTGMEAQQACAATGGHVVTVHSTAEHALVQTMSTSSAANLWIDLNDALTEGLYVWTTGEPVVFTPWTAGQPDNLGEQDCVVHVGAMGTWDDCQCAGCAYVPLALCESELWPW